MSENFFALPSAIFSKIWDYCGPNEILAVSSTCRMLHNEIESCMLVIDAERRFFLQSFEIPIFFADHCHSVFLTVETHNYGNRIKILSGNRQQDSGHYGNMVWKGTKHITYDEEYLYDISFRTEPSQRLILRDEGIRWQVNMYDMTLRKQFMTSAVTPAMRDALSACLYRGSYERDVWSPRNSLKQRQMMRLFIKLFVRGTAYLSEESSPIRRCLESGGLRKVQVDNPRFCLIQQIINLFEQTFEQKEPMGCVKLPVSADQVERCSGHPRTHQVERAHTYELPTVCLTTKFQWEQSNRRDFHQDKGILFHDELVFVARIPLLPNTVQVIPSGNIWIDSPTSLFVIFFQKRQNGLDNVEHPIDGHVIIPDDDGTLGLRLDVKPEYEACFLYFVPAKATRLELTELTFCLVVLGDDHNEELMHWMVGFFRGFCNETSSGYRRVLPIILLRDSAVALLGPDQEQNSELKEAFDTEGLDTTREGLESLVEVCNVLLQDNFQELST